MWVEVAHRVRECCGRMDRSHERSSSSDQCCREDTSGQRGASWKLCAPIGCPQNPDPDMTVGVGGNDVSAEQCESAENVSTTSTVVRYVSNPSAAAASGSSSFLEIQGDFITCCCRRIPKRRRRRKVIDPRSSSYPSILVTSNQTKLCGL